MKANSIIALNIFFILILASSVLAIGASPASLNFPNMLRDGYSEQTIIVSNPSDEDILVTLGGEGETSEWITAEPSQVILPPKSSAPIVIKVQPLGDIANGIYRNDILILGSPLNAGEGQVAIIGGVSLVVTAEITDQESKGFEVRKVNIPATEECRPVEITLTVVNTGNVRTSGKFYFIIKSSDSVLKTHEYQTETMLPTHEYSLFVEIPYEVDQYQCIPIGKYSIDIIAELDGQEIYSETHTLIVSERGSLSILGELSEVIIPSNIEAGQLVRIQADFKNTGDLTYRAQLVGELYSGDSISDTIKGDLTEVLRTETKTLELFYRPILPGDYTLRLYALDSISGARTIEIEYPINVAMPLIYIGAIILLVAIILFVIYKKFIKKSGIE
jgi:hypothetical protein